MGYLSGWDSKKQLVDYIVSFTQKLVTKRVVGNHLWMVVEDSEGTNVIALYLLSAYRGEWGYKSMVEASGPYYYDCPLALLEKAPEANIQWRAEVRNYHKAKAARTAYVKSIGVGDVVELQNCKVPQVVVTAKVGNKIYGAYGGVTYKVPAKYVKVEVELEEIPLTERELKIKNLQDSGKYLRSSALNAGEKGVHVLFTNKVGETVGYYMPVEVYHEISLGEPASVEDYEAYGELTPAPAEFQYPKVA